jgi:hypothetical protein
MIRVDVGGPDDGSFISDNRAESSMCAPAYEQPFRGHPSASSKISQDATGNSVVRLDLPRKRRHL